MHLFKEKTYLTLNNNYFFTDKSCSNEKVFQTCSSKKNRRTTCNCDVGKIISVRFVKGDTKKCLEGKTWGFTEDYVWVDDGCSAKFELCVKGK